MSKGCKRCPLAEFVRVAVEDRDAISEEMHRRRAENKRILAEAEDLKAERDHLASELATMDGERQALRGELFQVKEALRARETELGEAYDKLDSVTEQLDAAHEVIRQMEEKQAVEGSSDMQLLQRIGWLPGKEPGVWVKESTPEDADRTLRDAGFEV